MPENGTPLPEQDLWNQLQQETMEHLQHVFEGAQRIAEVEQEKQLFEAYNATTSVITNLLPLLVAGAPEVAKEVRLCLEAIQVGVHGKEVADELKLAWDTGSDGTGDE